jgi:hypothetical protein
MELHTYSVTDKMAEHKQNWVDHVSRRNESSLPKLALQYKSAERRIERRLKKCRMSEVGTGLTREVTKKKKKKSGIGNMATVQKFEVMSVKFNVNKNYI